MRRVVGGLLHAALRQAWEQWMGVVVEQRSRAEQQEHALRRVVGRMVDAASQRALHRWAAFTAAHKTLAARRQSALKCRASGSRTDCSTALTVGSSAIAARPRRGPPSGWAGGRRRGCPQARQPRDSTQGPCPSLRPPCGRPPAGGPKSSTQNPCRIPADSILRCAALSPPLLLNKAKDRPQKTQTC